MLSTVGMPENQHRLVQDKAFKHESHSLLYTVTQMHVLQLPVAWNDTAIQIKLAKNEY